MRPRQTLRRGESYRSSRDALALAFSPSENSSRTTDQHQDARGECHDHTLPISSSSRAHRRMIQRHRGIDVHAVDTRFVSYVDECSAPPRVQYMQQRDRASQSKKATASGPQQRDSLDEILESDEYNLPRRRRVKRAPSGQTQHGELLVFVRVFVSVIVISAILCIFVACLFWILYNLSSYASLLASLFNNDSSRGNAHLDASFVQNVEDIRRILELARTQYDALARDNVILHSVRTEEDLGLFELIPHPGNPSMHISVPRFYASVTVNGGDSPSTNKNFREFTNGKLLTPDLASIISQSISANEENDPSQRTIFVSLLSNNDQYCPSTVTNILNSASNPERIRIAIVDRTDSASADYTPCDEPMQPCDSDPEQVLCKFITNIDVYELRSDLDAGAIFSHHIANRMVSHLLLRLLFVY